MLSNSADFPEEFSHLERILIALQDLRFAINANKCSFFKRSIKYLGNVVSDGQVRPSPRKVEALVKAPVPKTVKQVMQFNGLAGYFKKYIPDLSCVMVPSYELTKQGAKWTWSDKHEKACTTIIECLISAPVFTSFQEEAPIKLYTDASSLGFSCSTGTADGWTPICSCFYEHENHGGWKSLPLIRVRDTGRDTNPEDYVLKDDVLKKNVNDPVFGQQLSTVVLKSFQWIIINSFQTTLKHTGWEKTLQKIK